MEADVVAVHEETLDAICENSSVAEVRSVRGVGNHYGDYRDAGPETLCNCCDGVHKSWVER